MISIASDQRTTLFGSIFHIAIATSVPSLIQCREIAERRGRRQPRLLVRVGSLTLYSSIRLSKPYLCDSIPSTIVGG
jgi:hypothetical protein